jgi:NADPH:quinone reductase
VKAVRVHAVGGPDVLQYEEIDIPRPGPGEAVITIAASGVNYLDVQYRTGFLKVPTPFVIGSEGAGVVADVGPGVTEVKVSERVGYAMALGSYAEYAVVPAWKLVPLPSSVDLQTGAAVMLQGLTAHYLTHSTFPLKRGDTALVHAAAGGVGQAVTQAARIRGARVIGTAGTDAKAAIALEAGAHEVIVYTKQDFEAEVKRLTDGRGVDVVYDSVGKDTFEKSLNCLRPRGYRDEGLTVPHAARVESIHGDARGVDDARNRRVQVAGRRLTARAHRSRVSVRRRTESARGSRRTPHRRQDDPDAVNVGAAFRRPCHRPGTTFNTNCNDEELVRPAALGATLRGSNGISSSGFVVVSISVPLGSEIGSVNQ